MTIGGVRMQACREAATSPAATRRLLLTSLVLATAMLADAWACRHGALLSGAVVELLALAVGASLLAPVARVSRLPWITAGLVGAAMLGERLAGLTPVPSGSAVIAMMLSATAPSMGVGLMTAGLLAGAEVVAALI